MKTVQVPFTGMKETLLLTLYTQAHRSIVYCRLSLYRQNILGISQHLSHHVHYPCIEERRWLDFTLPVLKHELCHALWGTNPRPVERQTKLECEQNFEYNERKRVHLERA